jgi:phage tail-like protein
MAAAAVAKEALMPVFRDDPYPVYNFEVVVNGISDDGASVRGSFSEVSGLETETNVIEYRNGSEPNTVRKLPGLTKFSNITLKRGLIGDLTFWNWLVNARQGNVKRTQVAIILLDENRNEVMRWIFTRAWPCKWAGPGFNAKGNEVALETLEICHEGMTIDGQV